MRGYTQKNKLYVIFLFCFIVTRLSSQNPFIENKGQLPEQVKAQLHLKSGSLFFEKDKLIYSFYSGEKLAAAHDLGRENTTIDAHAYKVEFVDAGNNSKIELFKESSYFENYFIGKENKWARKVKSYKILFQKNIYEGVDVKYYVEKDKLKYEIIVDPNITTNQIQIKYNGVDNIMLKSDNIYIITSVNTIKENKPYAYQKINGKQVEVECNYVLQNNILSFSFPKGYNKDEQLIIDPVLEFSTYSGSTTDNFGYTATYDNFGFLYSGSTSFGNGYPTTIGAYQMDYTNTLGGTDIAITKYDTSGTVRIYSTYLGGDLDELPHSMIVNSNNELFVFGTTGSEDFPITNSAFQPNFNGGPNFSPTGIGVTFPSGTDIFVSRISASGGDLLASTFIGGEGNDGLNISPALKYNYADEVRGEIDIDQQNNVYIATCTNSPDFPIVNGIQNTLKGDQDGCVVKMDNQLSSIVWSTYIGGSNDDAIYSLALDTNDNIYVAGGTNSMNLPVSTNAYQNTLQDTVNPDAFITKISSNGNQIISASYFGSNQYDQAYFIELGNDNLIYLFGQTESSGVQLVNNATYHVSGGGQFIAVFSADLSTLIRSTVFGTGKGSPDISPTAFLVDICNKIYISGWGSNLGGSLSTLNLPVTSNAYQSNTDGNDIYLMVLDKALSNIIYATYFGGSQSNEHVDGGTSRFDKRGIIYQSVCAGCGGNSDFPIEPNPGAVATTNNSSNCNNGVFKFNFDFPMIIADFHTTWVGCDTEVVFQNLTTYNSTVNYSWNFGDGTFSNDENPTHVYTQPGYYTVTLIATDNNTCNITDTIVKQIYILSNSSDTLPDIFKCLNEQTQIGLPPTNSPQINYFWFPSNNLTSPDISNPFSQTNTTEQYQLLISNENCTDTLYQKIIVVDLNLNTSADTFYCNKPVELSSTFFSNTPAYIQWSSNNIFSDTLSTQNNIFVSNIGSYYIKVYNEYCIATDSINVLSEDIDIDFLVNDVCLGDLNVIEIINLNTESPIISYNWSLNNLDTNIITDTPETSLWYTVEVISLDSCKIKDSVFVNVFPNSVINTVWVSDTIVFRGEQITIEVLTPDQINWEDFLSQEKKQNAYPNTSKCYLFEVYNDFNCNIKDSVCIIVKDVFCDTEKIKIPNAFSPNGDNVNDTYFIQDEEGVVTNFKLEIFNRLGQKVFYSTSISNTWNGTFNGEELNPQVFDFYLQLECIGGKELFHSGNITLIR